VVVATREQTAALNAAIRDRLVTEGRVDDRREVVTGAGERIGVGDRIATRRNNRDLDVANRDVWTVTGVGRDGGLVVTSDGGPQVTPTGDVSASVAPAVPPAGTGARALPADYVTAHVELAHRLSFQVRVRAIRLRPGRTDRLARRACAATWRPAGGMAGPGRRAAAEPERRGAPVAAGS